MFDDLDFERPATLRWLDADGTAGMETCLEGTLRQALQSYGHLLAEEQACATVTVAPVPGDWSTVVYEGRDLRRMARRRSSGRVLGFLEAAARLRRPMEPRPARLEWPDADLRLRNTG